MVFPPQSRDGCRLTTNPRMLLLGRQSVPDDGLHDAMHEQVVLGRIASNEAKTEQRFQHAIALQEVVRSIGGSTSGGFGR